MNRRIFLLLVPAIFSVMVSAESVRKVDFREVPERKELAERARQIGNEMYPKVLALLGDDASASPHQFDIVFKKRLPRQYSEGVKGVTSGSKIRLDGNFLKNNPVGFEAYLRQRHSGTEIGALHDSLGYANGQPPQDVVTRYLILQYFNQPAGMVTQEAAEFLADLGSKTNVPGWSDKIWFDLIPDGWSIDFPVSRTFHGHVTGDQSLYHYLVVRESKDSDWKIKRAWQTVAGGGIAEEYPLPER